MPESNDYTKELRLIRSLLIVSSLQERRDLKALELIQKYSRKITWNLDKLKIDHEIWNYVKNMGYDPKFVFCHPKVLIYKPATSLYYRGLSGLSLKAAKSYLGAVDALESGGLKINLEGKKALLMAQTYNSFICSIIKNSNAWTLENGYRTIIANLGITIDGVMRNKIGVIVEQRIRTLILEWLIEHHLIIKPELTKEKIRDQGIPASSILKGNIGMKFGSEPDIAFIRDEVLLAVVEIKGGTDPAGALERYGAATKSFQHATSVSKRCKNFYLVAVVTEELMRRMEDDRLVDSRFDIVKLLEEPGYREDFFNELFHHTLRMI